MSDTSLKVGEIVLTTLTLLKHSYLLACAASDLTVRLDMLKSMAPDKSQFILYMRT